MNTVINREPTRSYWGFSCYLWGWDDSDNPAFAVLYGEKSYNRNQQDELKCCVVFRGENKHFPSFEDVRLCYSYGGNGRQRTLNMYYKRDTHGYWVDEEAAPVPAGDYYKFDAIKIDLSKEYSYSDIVEKLKINFTNFRLAASPSEVLQLSPELSQYEDTIIALFTNPNIYSRRKIMTELVKSNPPKGLLHYLIYIGSDELISGMFLEFAKQRNPMLEKEAQDLLDLGITQMPKGILRCIEIYLAAICNEKSQEKISQAQELLLAYKKSIQEKGSVYLASKDKTNVVNVKSVFQLAEALRNGELLGESAYCIDAENYLCNWDSNRKSIIYLKRYARRILNDWADTNEAQFMQALKVIYTSYREVDWKPHFTISSLFFMKQYLFPELSSFDEPKWKNKKGEKKRLEYRPDIWDRHLDIVVDIACETKIPLIASSMKHILKYNDTNKIYTKNLPIEKLIALAESPHSDISELGIKYLARRLKKATEFDYDTVMLLLNSRNENILKLAMEYLKSFGEKLSPQILVALMFMSEVFDETFKGLEANDYIEFLKALFSNANKCVNQIATSELVELLDNSIAKLKSVSIEQKTTLVQHIISELVNQSGLPQFIINYAEKIIFSFPETEINQIAQSLDLSAISDYRSALIFNVLHSIKDNVVPELELIMSVLGDAFPSTLNTFVQLLTNHKNQLTISHWILLFESSVFALNELAKNAFISMEDEKTKFALHSRLLDSPDEKTYRFGIQQLEDIYVGDIPAKFLLEMLEHTSVEVRVYASGKVKQIIESFDSLGENNLMNRKELFVRYAKTLLFLPNKATSSKKNIYGLLPKFVGLYKETQTDVEEMLLELGASNVKSDSEQALVTLAKIKAGVAL